VAKKKEIKPKEEINTNTELVDALGSYTQNYFYGDKGKWIANGSKNNGSVLTTLDTFKSEDNGSYITMQRVKIKELFKNKTIWMRKE
jgi:hypothetical protein